MGTADELTLDVLINMLTTFSKEHVGIKNLIIGGVNADWPVPTKKEPDLMDDAQLEKITRLARQTQKSKSTPTEDEMDSATDFEPLLDDLIDDDDSDLF